MKRKHLIIILIFALLGGGFLGYRAYQTASQREADARQAALVLAESDRLKLEAEKRAAAEAEARRLSELKAQDEARQNEEKLARLRAQQEANEAARLAAAEEARKVAAQLERLNQEKLAAEAEAKAQAELRAQESAAAEKARIAALKRLEALEHERDELAAAQAAAKAAADAAGKRAPLWAPGPLLGRNILPADYKRRQHYYQQVFTFNAEASRPPEKPSPLKQ